MILHVNPNLKFGILKKMKYAVPLDTEFQNLFFFNNFFEDWIIEIFLSTRMDVRITTHWPRGHRVSDFAHWGYVYFFEAWIFQIFDLCDKMPQNNRKPALQSPPIRFCLLGIYLTLVHFYIHWTRLRIIENNYEVDALYTWQKGYWISI